MWRSGLKAAAARLGYDIARLPNDVDTATRRTVVAVRPYTRTTPARVIALCEAVRYITAHGIGGDIVECGVWRGGSMLAAARTLVESRDCSRTLWLYDTYAGMTPPTKADRRAGDGVLAEDLMREPRHRQQVLAVAGAGDVRRTMARCAYPGSRIRYVVGPVEETIPATVPPSIALLRLDTDWYASTRHELTHLVPLMAPGSVLILDDYGHWEGARRAVDEYLAAARPRLLLHRIDYGARIGVIQPQPA